MRASVGYLVIDITDPQRRAPFWCALLDVQVDAEIGDGQFVVLCRAKDGFQRVPDAESGKNRLHLDLVGDDLDAATTEIQTLGGWWLEPSRTRELEGLQWRSHG